MNSYSTDDPVADLLNGTTTGDDDIPEIQRDNSLDYVYNGSNNNNNSSHTNNINNDNDNKNNHGKYYNKNTYTNPLIDQSLTSTYQPSPLPLDDYQLVPQVKFNSTTYPPIPELSESVLPPSLSIKTLGGLPSNIGNNTNNNINNNKFNGVAGITAPPPKKRKEPTGPKTRPAFVMKIWSMVNDPVNKQYIRWSDDGKSFHVFHREEFMKVILPKYFKHNNFASFVRQLNMYGWHKVQDINNGSLFSQTAKDDKATNDNSNVASGGVDEIWQFENPYFIKDREDLLDKIQRNKATANDNEIQDPNVANFSLILNELDQIKLNQLAISEDLRRVRNDNKTLWHENYLTRDRHQQQAQTLDKILSFLATVYGNSNGKILELENSPVDIGGVLAPYRQQQEQQNQQQQNQQKQQQQNQQHHQQQQQQQHSYRSQDMQQLTTQSSYDYPPSPFHKPRLMLMDQAYQKSPEMVRNSGVPTNDNNADSVEEIMRSYENTPRNNSEAGGSSNNAAINKMYQQLINQDHPSPRHFFPDLKSPYFEGNRPSTPQPQTPGGAPQSEVMNILEQNISKQGQSIQQVQDWIQKLATQQQILQENNSKLQQQENQINNNNNNSTFNDNFEVKPDLEEFDVNDFLDPSNSGLPPTPNLQDLHSYSNKRAIEEVEDDAEHPPSKKKI